MLIETRPQRLYASYHQFYIADDFPFRSVTSGRLTDARAEDELWTSHTFADRISSITGMLGVSTGSYGYVKVITEIHSSPPELHPEQWDHITESPLEARSGRLVVIGCMETKGERFQLPPGNYRVRCCHANLAGARESGEGDDWYRVQIWPAEPAPAVVLKRAARTGTKAPAPPSPVVKLQLSTAAEFALNVAPNRMVARAITLRRLISIAYAIYPAQEYPMDHILGPLALDIGRYDVSATGAGWPTELRRVLSERFQWRFDMVMRPPGNGSGSAYYLAIRDIHPPDPQHRRR